MLQVKINDGSQFEVSREEGQWIIDGKTTELDVVKQPNGLISVLNDGRSYTAFVEKIDRVSKEVVLRIDGQQYKTKIQEPIDQLLKSMGLDMAAMQKTGPVKAPMPGLIIKVLVEAGQKVEKGDGLVILEAMKMENLLKATSPGIVKAVKVGERTAVEKGAVLIEME